MALIDVCELEFDDLGRRVLSGISFSIEEGERVAVLGANDSGKTALALWLSGWLPAHGITAKSGSVTFRGRPWSDLPLTERASTVQLVGPVPFHQLSGREFTVRDEIAFGPGNLGLDRQEVQSRVCEAIALCGLEALRDRDPYTLSGGEQQMVVLANALAMHPKILVLDEPLASLDPQAARRILRVIAQLPASTTILLVDISPWVAVHVAQRFLLLREGRCIADGSAENVLLQPDAISLIGLPVSAEAAWMAQERQGWAAGVPTPLTVDSAVAAFREVARARG
ncbi:MAG TPA: ABC transporter ATP-binding protein [Acidobacteriota bacterium]|nr:ABC transporter ATP-binding protein [Acidobacteriota bacterium]